MNIKTIYDVSDIILTLKLVLNFGICPNKNYAYTQQNEIYLC